MILALFLVPVTTQAQRGRRTVKKQKVEEPVEDPRITQMRAATQQVTFVDSMVVDRKDFMAHIPLSPHVGKLSITQGLGTFTNEMGDRRLFTTVDSLIASSDFIANRWTEAQLVAGIGTAKAINPFLMPDGITLYYAQRSEKSIGKYDIFVTRYDSEKGVFLHPENIGMPFASEADDLFYAVDEFNQLGYFVTDRRQPAGKVCIYIFIPQQTRRLYNTEAYSEAQMRSLAAIGRIADTWTDKQERQEALTRLQTARSKLDSGQKSMRSPLSSELDKLRHQADVEEKALTLARNRFATASEAERITLSTQILQAEVQLEKLQTEIRDKEKQIPYEQ